MTALGDPVRYVNLNGYYIMERVPETEESEETTTNENETGTQYSSDTEEEQADAGMSDQNDG